MANVMGAEPLASAIPSRDELPPPQHELSGSATGKLSDQARSCEDGARIMAISWADGALQRWYFFAMRRPSAWRW
eukprot:Skav217505  [mRNA]  locus=scaffold1908:351303:351994:- [translate_table: standard]